jgi:Transposase DDE domain
MPPAIEQYVTSLQAFVADAPNHADIYFERPGKDFTRTRSLPFSTLVWHQTSMLNRTLASELYNLYCLKFGCDKAPTKSALSQARGKIKTAFFKDFFSFSSKIFYQYFTPQKWKSFLIKAIDGSSSRLPKKKQIGEDMGWITNQHSSYPHTKFLMIFDVLNKIIVDSYFFAPNVSEAKTAYKVISSLTNDSIHIYDRGFGFQITMALHNHFGSHVVARMRTDIDIVRDFIESGAPEQIITQEINSDTVANFKELGIDTSKLETVTYRLVRVELNTGEIEVLGTTLLDQVAYKAEEFGELYNWRWGVETCFYVVKSYLELLNFSTFKSEGCKKEFYQKFIFYNIQSALIHSVEPEVKAVNARRRLDYQVNRNASICCQRDLLHELVKRPISISTLLVKVKEHMLSNLESIRPNRERAKVRKPENHKTGRHFTQTNYRRA